MSVGALAITEPELEALRTEIERLKALVELREKQVNDLRSLLDEFGIIDTTGTLP